MTENNLLPPPVIETPQKQEILKPLPSKSKLLPILLITILSMIFVGSLFAAYYYGSTKTTADIPTPTPTFTLPTATPSPKPVEGQITWLSKPKKIAALNIFNDSKNNPDLEGYHFSESTFYEVATLPDASKLINIYLPTDGMGTYNTIFHVIKSPEGNVSFVDQYGNQWPGETKGIFTPEVTLSSFNIRELSPPDNLIIGSGSSNVYFKKVYLDNKTFDKLVNPKLVKSTEFGDLYATYQTHKENPDIASREFYLKLKDWSIFSYTENIPFFSDNMTVYLNWSDGSTVNSQFTQKISSGCGSGIFGPDTIKDGSPTLASKVQVATYNGKPIYQIKDPNNAILKELYQGYTSRYYEPTNKPVLSLEDFVNTKNHFLYQDFLGDWLIFTNLDYIAAAECAKPVIYLYPTKDTLTTVKVGAEITKSEPLYPQNGWTVLAHPNGQLEYQNQIYPNLFWEGTGHGLYPNLTNYGFVVAQKDLISTLRSQLTQLGLNSQESADFMEFWTDKLPTSPYVRLTWLGTAEMNQLAPLSVNPKPDTSIRIFLDFAALDKPIKLTPQKLSAPQRLGFTLVEWGGLLVK